PFWIRPFGGGEVVDPLAQRIEVGAQRRFARLGDPAAHHRHAEAGEQRNEQQPQQELDAREPPVRLRLPSPLVRGADKARPHSLYLLPSSAVPSEALRTS